MALLKVVGLPQNELLVATLGAARDTIRYRSVQGCIAKADVDFCGQNSHKRGVNSRKI
jgi:hypothetical protein